MSLLAKHIFALVTHKVKKKLSLSPNYTNSPYTLCLWNVPMA